MTPAQQSAAIADIIGAATNWHSRNADRLEGLPSSWEGVVPVLKAAPRLLEDFKWIARMKMDGEGGFVMENDDAVETLHSIIETARGLVRGHATQLQPTPGLNRYSVLLAYPDYLDDDGTETFYAFVEAADSVAAVAEAQRQAAEANEGQVDDPTDFAVLLVTAGHNEGLATEAA